MLTKNSHGVLSMYTNNLTKLAYNDDELARIESLVGYDSERRKSEENYRKFNNPYRHTNERLQAFKEYRDYQANQDILNPREVALKNAKSVGIPISIMTGGMGALIGSNSGLKGAVKGGLGGLALGGLTALGAGLSARDQAILSNAVVNKARALQGMDDEKNTNVMNSITINNAHKRQQREIQRQMQLQRVKEIERQEAELHKKHGGPRQGEVIRNYRRGYET
jgi:hypothetical protein